jgi:hypothetical protein
VPPIFLFTKYLKNILVLITSLQNYKM